MELSIYFDEILGRSSPAGGKFQANDIKTFLREMRRTPSGPLIISKLLANKIQSKTDAVAIQAFEFLEALLETEVEGSIEFRTEIGRYRFLNEIIRILSPKYLGATTSDKVKERAIKFLKDAAGLKRKKWFPSEFSKIETVFKSLVEGGVIVQKEEDISAADPDAEFRKNIFERGENAVLLRKLLQSKDPNDLQAANRLIKNLVDEEAQRNERRSELHSLLDRIETSTCVLSEMLTQPRISDFDLIEELVESCTNLRCKLGTLRTETNEETTSLVQASVNIETVLELYEKKKKKRKHKGSSREVAAEEEGEDVLVAAPEPKTVPPPKAEGLSLVDELLMGIDLSLVQSTEPQRENYRRKMEDENNLLNLDIELENSYGSGVAGNILDRRPSKDVEDSGPLKQPFFDELNKMSRELMNQSLGGGASFSPGGGGGGLESLQKTEKKSKSSTLHELQMLTNNSPLNNTNSKAFPLSSGGQSLLPSLSSATGGGPGSNILYDLDLGYLENAAEASRGSSGSTQHNSNPRPGRLNSSSSGPEDDNLLGLDLDIDMDGSTTTTNCSVKNATTATAPTASALPLPSPSSTPTITAAAAANNKPIKSPNSTSTTTTTPNFLLSSLKDIRLELDEIELIDSIPPVLKQFDDKISLSLTFGQFPQKLPPSVKAAVITVTNTNSTAPLLNYVFQLLPPKGVQVKLLPPSVMELPEWKKKFLPPPVLTQIALFVPPPAKSISSNFSMTTAATDPAAASICIKFILSYCLGGGAGGEDDEETVLRNENFLLPNY